MDAGWYPDPDGTARNRWWDGGEWTWQVSAGAVVEWAPLPSAVAEPAQPGLPGLATAAVGFGLGVGLSVLAQVLFGDVAGLGGPTLFGVAELALWVGLVGAVWVVSRRRGSGSLAEDFGLRFRPVDLAFGLAGSLAGRLMASAAAAPFSVFLLHQSPDVDQKLYQAFAPHAGGWLVLVLVTCVGAPVVEELFFRGLVQTRLVARMGPVSGIGLTSLVFGAAHLVGWAGPVSLVYAWSIAAAGVALGTIRHLTGRLGTSMAAHALFNAQAMAVLAATVLVR